MKPVDSFLLILLAAGAIQGLIYGFILLKKNAKNKSANLFLATILFFFSYRLIVEICKLFGYGFYDFWYHVFIEFNWIYGALIYFFVKASVTPKFKINFKKDWIHFLPVFIEFLWSNFIKSQNFYWDGTQESLSWLGYYGYIVWMHYPTMFIISGLLIIFYAYKSSQILKQKRDEHLIYIDKVQWIKRVLFVLKYYAIFLIVVVLVDVLFFDYAFRKYYSYPLFIGMAIVTYWLGLEGFNRRNNDVIKTQNILPDKEKQQLEQIAKALKKLMEEDEIYTNSDLNLAILSEKLNVKPYQTTKCLNVIFGKKFNDFVNEYRIKALKDILKNPKNEKFTLLSLAFDVGFNSKSSFNRAVKKITGKSPKDLKSSN
ncbi:helix-turn-helix domain-containing protein [Polaribacter sp. P097]|uniref:helix-turn-helix domain-containing protein n=1 Tax=Polaribacter sp. P097 TaxID=3117398 RepID=UPI002FDFD451